MNKEFKKALEVFNDSIIAHQLTGSDENVFPKSWQKRDVPIETPVQKKLEMLYEELMGWVILKSQEMDEFEGEDLIRLRGEAVGCMYAIRELKSHFVELKNT